jgi:trimeric autotransporter adhesin
VNAASLLPGPISAGEIVTLFGSVPAAPHFRMDGLPMHTIYSGPSEVNVMIPFGLTPARTHRLEVHTEGGEHLEIPLDTAQFSPAIFTQNGSGTGPGVILNQDHSLNSASNPSPPDSIITIYGTGFGRPDPPLVDDQLASKASTPTPPVTADIAGIPAQVIDMGAAPGLIPGLLQINVRIPTAVKPDPQAVITLQIGDARSQSGITVAIQ